MYYISLQKMSPKCQRVRRQKRQGASQQFKCEIKKKGGSAAVPSQQRTPTAPKQGGLCPAQAPHGTQPRAYIAGLLLFSSSVHKTLAS